MRPLPTVLFLLSFALAVGATILIELTVKLSGFRPTCLQAVLVLGGTFAVSLILMLYVFLFGER